MVAWTLAASSTLLLIALLAFTGILLVGNSLVSRGVAEGGMAVGGVLPELVQVRDKATEEVVERVLGEYGILLDETYTIFG